MRYLISYDLYDYVLYLIKLEKTELIIQMDNWIILFLQEEEVVLVGGGSKFLWDQQQ